jgi:Synergist-CTERM protein sorting domain-containing protein
VVTSFDVDGTIGEVAFFAGWTGASADVTLALKRPSGAKVIVASSDYLVQGGLVSFSRRISSPDLGIWSLTLTNATAVSLDVSSSANGEPKAGGTGYAVTLGLADGGSSVTAPNPALLLVRVNRNGVALKNATVQANLTLLDANGDPVGTPVTLNFRDDGTHGDALANDGIYSAIVSSYVAGSYKVSVTVSNPSGTAQETYSSGSPSVPKPGDPTVFNPSGAVVPESFVRTSSLQFKTDAAVTPTPTPIASPTPTTGPAPTSSPTPTGTHGGGGGCSAAGLIPLGLVLLIPALLVRRRTR